MSAAAGPRLELWKAIDGWRWRLRARNGRIIAESGEAYSGRHVARLALRKVTIAFSEVEQPPVKAER